MPGTRRNLGVSQIARDTGFSVPYVSILLKGGASVADIKKRAALRDAGQTQYGRNANNKERTPVTLPSSSTLPTVDPTAQPKIGYVPSRQRGTGGTGGTGGTRAGLSKADLAPARESVPAEQQSRQTEVGGISTTRSKTGETLSEATLRKEIALADQREMENEVRRGDLVLRNHMANWLGTGIVMARDWLRRIPQELRDVIALETDPVRCEELMQKAVDEVLGRVSDYFREMVDGSVEEGRGEKAA